MGTLLAGIGVRSRQDGALSDEQLALQVAPGAGLSIYSAPMPIDLAQIAMVWHRRSTSAPGHCWLRDRIAEILSPLDDAGPQADHID